MQVYLINSMLKWFFILQKMTNALRCWEKYLKDKEFITDCLDKAEGLAKERGVENKQAIEQRKMFFQKLNENILQGLINSAKDLQNILPSESQVIITLKKLLFKN